MANEFVARKGLISLSTSSFYGPVNFTSGSSLTGVPTSSVLFTNTSGSVTGSTSFVWDNVNGRLGIGTSSPEADIDVSKSVGSTNSVNARVTNTNSTGEAAFVIRNDVSEYGALEIFGSSWVSTTQRNLVSFTSAAANGFNVILYNNSATAHFRITSTTSQTERFRVFGNTGNVLIQNGGTFTDAGYRLDVIGTVHTSDYYRVEPGYGIGLTSAWGSNTKIVFENTGLVPNGIVYNTENTSNKHKWQAGGIERMRLDYGNLIIGTSTNTWYRLQVDASGSASGSFLISGSTTQPATLGNTMTSVNIIPTMVFTTGSQTQTAFKVMPTFSGSAAFTSSQTNIIADFGATSVGSQLIVTDVTSGSIYMVNDVSGIPIIEANSNWDVLMYDYPYTVFKKTGSAVELGVAGQASSSVTLKSDLVINEGLGFTYRQAQASGSTNGAVTSSLYNITFTNTSASVYINAIVTGYDTGSRDTIAGDIKATIRYRSGVASVVGIDQTFINTDNSVVGFDIVAGGTSGSLVAFGTGSRVYQWGATITTQVI